MFAGWTTYKGSMLVHTLQYQNLRELLTNGDQSWTWKSSINTYTTYISRWKNLKQSGSGSRRTPSVGLELKDAILHVPMSARVKRFLRFKWKGKLYEWQVLPFGLKCSPRILTCMVKPIVRFLHRRGISLMAFMDDFANQARCRCKAIFQIHVMALVFMCCGW